MFQNSKKEYTRISPDNEISLSLSLNSRTHYPACKALVIRRIWNLDNEYNRITSIARQRDPAVANQLIDNCPDRMAEWRVLCWDC